jgi:CRISPR-associated exonuclease Cas4
VNASESDDDLPISALQHLEFCERQVALIHVLGRWAENVHTTIGRLVHERVDAGASSRTYGVRVLRTVRLRSDRLKLKGTADVVEIHDGGALVPIEYKRSGRKRRGADDVQLAAQAIALEEMTGRPIDRAFVFMAKTGRRRLVLIDDGLRARVADSAHRLHALIGSRRVPPAFLDARCEDCSLHVECAPEAVPATGQELARQIRAALRATE